MTKQRSLVSSPRSPVMQWLMISVGLCIVISAGALYGHYSQRWGPPVDLVVAGSHLETFPDQIGEWQLIEEMSMKDTVVEMLECAGYVSRRYANTKTGKTISIALIVGPSGPTAVHTPEICFSSRAYNLKGQRKSIEIKSATGKKNTFWRVDFKTQNVFADELLVYYAWSLGKHWDASHSPRIEYAASPYLYKIQLSSEVSPNIEAADADPCLQFLAKFIDSGWAIGSN